MADHLERFFDCVRAIPPGKVMSYKGVGRLAGVTARQAGKLLTLAESEPPDAFPWWRVVAWDGSLPVAKRNPAFAVIQKEKLQSEGVAFRSEWRVDMRLAASEEDDV